MSSERQNPHWDDRECGWCKGVTGETVRCWCATYHSRHTAGYQPVKAMSFYHMYVCPECGNKRCQRASSHTFPCVRAVQ